MSSPGVATPLTRRSCDPGARTKTRSAEERDAARFRKPHFLAYSLPSPLPLEPWASAALRWPEDRAEDRGVTAWHVAKPDSKWFAPSDASFMINYRVDDLGELLANLRAAGVEVLQGPESHENGKFAWIVDPDGNKVELWEPKIWDEKNKAS